MKKRKIRPELVFCCVFFAVLYLVPASYLLAGEREFSDLENRKLRTEMKLSREALLSGRLAAEAESYLADQFPARDGMLYFKSAFERAAGKTESNGVYRGKGNRLFQKFKAPDQKLLKKNMKYINQFAKNFHVYFMLAPSAAGVYPEELPKNAKPYSEKTFHQKVKKLANKKVKLVPLFSRLEDHKKEYIYYRTDHHWTTLGAYYAYRVFCKKAGLSALAKTNYQMDTVSDRFYGSLYSMGNFQFGKPDQVTIFREKEKHSVKVSYIAENTETDTLYEEKWLKEKDKYKVFLDGNHPLITIQTDCKNGKKLAVIKDSFANCMIPFLTAHYEEIHVLDLRFLNVPVESYLKSSKIDTALLLYNVQNFAKETSFSKLNAK